MKHWLKKLKNAVRTAVSVLVLWDKGFKVFDVLRKFERISWVIELALERSMQIVTTILSWWENK